MIKDIVVNLSVRKGENPICRLCKLLWPAHSKRTSRGSRLYTI